MSSNQSNTQVVLYVDEAKEVKNPILCCCMTVKRHSAVWAIICAYLASQSAGSWRTFNASWAVFYFILVLTSSPMVFLLAGVLHDIGKLCCYLFAFLSSVVRVYDYKTMYQKQTNKDFFNWLQELELTESELGFKNRGEITNLESMLWFLVYIFVIVIIGQSMAMMSDAYYQYSDYLEQEKRKESKANFVSV